MSRRDGPGATLQNGMNEPSTRLDIRMKGGSGVHPSPDTGSIEIDIAIDVIGSQTPVLPIRHEGPPHPAPLPDAESVDEAPPEVFRPGKHPSPPRRSSRPPSRAPGRGAPRVEHDPWEAKTVVRREDGAPPIAPSRRREPSRPPEPERTVRIDGRKYIEQVESAPESIEIDFSDETRMLPPRRR
jgi:hypothetical protein